MKKIAAFFAFFVVFTSTVSFASAEEEILTPEPTVIMFGRDDCGFCKAQFKYLYDEGITYEYLNITKDDRAKQLYDEVAAKHEISKVTPWMFAFAIC